MRTKLCSCRSRLASYLVDDTGAISWPAERPRQVNVRDQVLPQLREQCLYETRIHGVLSKRCLRTCTATYMYISTQT